VRIGYRAEVKHITISIVSSLRDHEVVWPPYDLFFFKFSAQFFLSEMERIGE
jgi:hypothetical protein